MLAWIAIHIPFVQNWIVKEVAASFSKKLHTKVTIKHVDFALFDKMELQGLLIEDQHRDTLLYAGTANVNITDWFFFKEKTTLKYVGLKNTLVNITRSDSTWNYQFLVDYFSSPRKDTSSKKSNMEFDLKILELENIQFKQVDKWVGQDMTISLKKLDLSADLIDFYKKKIFITQLNLDEPVFSQSSYTGNKPQLNTLKDIVQKIPVLSALQWNTQGWEINIKDIHLNNASFSNEKETARLPYTNRFDGQHLQFTSINGDLKNVQFINDTVTTDLQLTANERSGLQVKKLEAKLKLTPAIMEFQGLALETNRSKIGNYFAMRYTNFNDDLSSFLHNINLDAKFENSIVNSNDLAYFAPATKYWNRVFFINGNVTGPPDNLSGKKLLIKTGNSVLDGDLALRGLPDFNNTFIDLKSNDLQTNYQEMAVLIPALRKVQQPQLSKLGNIRFKGNFTGFINDFVAFGTINTSLGSLTADINMKIPANKIPVYSGKISSAGFQLGQFLNNSKLGNIALDGKVKGTSFKINNLNADFDGKIHQLFFSGYNYQNITVNGNFAQKLFTGHLDIDDPNLKVHNLNGRINLSKDEPEFNFDAIFQYVNLRQLKITNEDFSLAGHFSLNFTGDNIDNFLGTAKVYDASLKHDSTRLSFDSLALTSMIVDGNKILDFQSNQIEGSLTGKFRIMELPDAFRAFLSRYYPSYIPTPSYNLTDQDFSFIIKTRVVDDYVKLIDKRLSGFDFSTFSGNIKSATNELNISADVPVFEYDGKTFNKIVVEAHGNFDTLLTKITAGDISFNDSLHFPKTDLTISAHNDVSIIHLKTSASSTLSEAELNASVQTLTDGVNIHFSPSSFIINDKKWQLAKDGELSIRKNYVSANEVKFVQGEQEIVISTAKDAVTGNTNVIGKLKKVNINDFTSLLTKKTRLEGLLTGTLTLKDPFGTQSLDFKGDAEALRIDDKMIGDTHLEADVNTGTGLINYKVSANNKENKFTLAGHYNYKVESDDQLSADFLSEHFNVNLLQSYLGSVFSDLTGDATSNLKIRGGNHKLVTGDVSISNGSFIVAYTQCKYKFDKHTISFKPDEIDIGSMQLRDTLNNTGKLSGKLFHTFFKDFSFENVHFETDKMLVLNTTKENNSQFYGKVIGSAIMNLDGPTTNLKINIDGNPSSEESDSSHIYLPTGSSREVGQIDYIDFVQFGSKMEDESKIKEGTNIVLDMHFTATRACKVDVILDESTGDVITGTGSGVLNIHTGTRENMTIRGRYDIADGQYMFNFQTFVKKYFTLRRGGSIVFNGNPYDAVIKIDAEYLAKRVDVSSLPSSKGFKQRENLTIVARLSGNLMKPQIQFDFEFPPNSDIADDYITQKALIDLKKNENEMNKQVASLLLFNTFISNNQNFLSGSNTISLAANTIGGIVSNMLTNLFNKQLEKATNGVLSTYFDINSNLDLQNKAALVQASVQAGLKISLSERLVVLLGGNIDYNNPYAQLARKGLITPDISIEWLLNKDGSLKVVGFNRTSVDLTLGQRNRSGVSLTYQKDFDKLSEIFRRNRVKKEVPKEATPKTTN